MLLHVNTNAKGRVANGRDILIFQLHLPHVIPNSMQALCALSHSGISFQKAPFPYQHVSLKFQLMPEQLSQIKA